MDGPMTMVINVQGDEPCTPAVMNMKEVMKCPDMPIATLSEPVESLLRLRPDPNVVGLFVMTRT